MRFNIFLVSLLLLAIVAVSCVSHIPEAVGLNEMSNGAISGEVTDVCNHSLLSNAQVEAARVQNGKLSDNRSSTTNEAGKFSFENLTWGTWQVSATHQGHELYQQVVEVNGDNKPQVQLAMIPSTLPAPQKAKLDVLFLIDNSPSMEQEQTALAQNIPALFKGLMSWNIDLDLRLGIISPNLGAGPYTTVDTCQKVGGDNGQLLNIASVQGCPQPTDPWISLTTQGGGTTNVPASGTLADADPTERAAAAFACIAPLGKTGCGFEQPLAAVQRALGPENPQKFRRADAALAVVIITDEDDCSAKNTALFDPTADATFGPFNFRCFEYGVTCDVNARTIPGVRTNCRPRTDGYLINPDDFISWFKKQGMSDGQGGVIEGTTFITVIAGPDAPVSVNITDSRPMLSGSCTSATGNADPAIRLKYITDHLQPYSSFTGICSCEFSAVLSVMTSNIYRGLSVSACRQ